MGKKALARIRERGFPVNDREARLVVRSAGFEPFEGTRHTRATVRTPDGRRAVLAWPRHPGRDFARGTARSLGKAMKLAGLLGLMVLGWLQVLGWFATLGG